MHISNIAMGGTYMDEIKDSLPGQTPRIRFTRPNSTSIPSTSTPPTVVRAPSSIARSRMILVLRGWHGYGRLRADRAINNWLYNHGPTHTGRA